MSESTETETAQFPQKLMSLLDDEASQQCMRWLEGGMAFEIHDPELFQETILKTHFNSIRLRSFVERLLKWGFTRMGEKYNRKHIPYTFRSELFRRDLPHLCDCMTLQNRKRKGRKENKEIMNDTGSEGYAVVPMPVMIVPVPMMIMPQAHTVYHMPVFSRNPPVSYQPGYPPLTSSEADLPRSKHGPPMNPRCCKNKPRGNVSKQESGSKNSANGPTRKVAAKAAKKNTRVKVESNSANGPTRKVAANAKKDTRVEVESNSANGPTRKVTANAKANTRDEVESNSANGPTRKVAANAKKDTQHSVEEELMPGHVNDATVPRQQYSQANTNICHYNRPGKSSQPETESKCPIDGPKITAEMAAKFQADMRQKSKAAFTTVGRVNDAISHQPYIPSVNTNPVRYDPPGEVSKPETESKRSIDGPIITAEMAAKFQADMRQKASAVLTSVGRANDAISHQPYIPPVDTNLVRCDPPAEVSKPETESKCPFNGPKITSEMAAKFKADMRQKAETPMTTVGHANAAISNPPCIPPVNTNLIQCDPPAEVSKLDSECVQTNIPKVQEKMRQTAEAALAMMDLANTSFTYKGERYT